MRKNNIKRLKENYSTFKSCESTLSIITFKILDSQTLNIASVSNCALAWKVTK